MQGFFNKIARQYRKNSALISGGNVYFYHKSAQQKGAAFSAAPWHSDISALCLSLSLSLDVSESVLSGQVDTTLIVDFHYLDDYLVAY